jgi:hypothetical protein
MRSMSRAANEIGILLTSKLSSLAVTSVVNLASVSSCRVKWAAKNDRSSRSYGESKTTMQEWKRNPPESEDTGEE